MPRSGSKSSPRFQLADGRVWAGDREIPLTPTQFSMLRYFAQNPYRLIDKQELLDAVWPNTHVTEDLVKDYVRKIRRILGDDAQQPRFIETVRGMGYRFVGDIGIEGASRAINATTVLPHPVPSIAVLAFADNSDSGDQTYFAAGIAEEVPGDLRGVDASNTPPKNSFLATRHR